MAKVEHMVQKTWPKWLSEQEVINTNHWDNTVNQSRLKSDTFSFHKAWENTSELAVIGFGFASDSTSKSHKFAKPKEMHIAFDA